MATSTTNLGLIKPAGSDKIRIAQINGNMDILDEKIGAVGNTSLQTQVTANNQAIGDLSSLATTVKTSVVAAINEVDGDIDDRIGSLKLRNMGNITSSGNMTINFESPIRMVLVGISSSENASFLIGVYSISNGTTYVNKYFSGSNITITTGTGSVTIANSNTGNSVNVFALPLGSKDVITN